MSLQALNLLRRARARPWAAWSRKEPPHRACSLGSDMDQRMDALRRANEVRALRAQLKRDLKASRVSLGALLRDPPPFLETAKVFDMLLALPRHGRVKAIKIMHSCRVSPSTTFGGLSERPAHGTRRAPRPVAAPCTPRGR